MRITHRLAACAIAVTTLALPAHRALALTCPKIMFVLDASGSMAQDPMGGNTQPSKFELARQAIIQFVNTYGDRVQIGLADLASDAWHNDQQCVDDTLYDPMKCAGMSGCDPTENACGCYGTIVEPAHNQAPQLLAAVKGIKNAPASWHTPIGETINRIAKDPAMLDAARKDYIVIITDGAPDCNSQDLMDLGQGQTPSFTIGAINDARNRMPTIHTWVVGFDQTSSDLEKESLSDMAQAGGEPVGTHSGEMQCGGDQPCYYSANGMNSVQDALAKIIDVSLGGEFGSVMCDDSCYSAGCPAGQVCAQSEQDPVARCIPDPCMGAHCSGDQYCKLGQCVTACGDGCAPSQYCKDGTCVDDPCAHANCPADQVCDRANGQCVANLCDPSLVCTAPTACDPVTGKCTDDQCSIITCPAGTSCQLDGQCVGKYTGAHHGCAVSRARLDGGVVFGLALSLVALAGLAFALRRRRG